MNALAVPPSMHAGQASLFLWLVIEVVSANETVFICLPAHHTSCDLCSLFPWDE